jgi:hypothetical protein
MKHFFTLLIFISPFFLFAQTNYQPGYVVKNTGDTLKGYINYKDWSRTPKTIEFKHSKADRQSIQFDAVNIKAFGMDGLETYIGYVGLVSMDKNKFPDIPSEEDTTVARDAIFLKQLATGPHLTLYYNDDAIKTRYFIAEANNKPVELKYFEYYDQYKRDVNSAVFKGQLLLYANKYIPGSSSIGGKIEIATFRQPDLETIVALINEKKNTSEGNRGNKFFAGIALDYTSSSISSITSIPFSNSATTTSIIPKIGVGWDFFDNPNVQHFAFRAELSFSFINPKYESPAEISGVNTYQYYTFSQFTTSVVPQFLLNVYNKDNFKVYVAAGASLNISFYPTNKFSVQSSNAAVVSADTKNNPYDLNGFWVSFPLQGGITLNKRLQLFYVYEFNFASYTSSAPYDVKGEAMNIGVRYVFGNK